MEIVMSRKYSIQEDESQLLLEKELQENHLVVYNDDVNTFDWVIESLIKVCNHDRVQAEQCSLIVHNMGKCSVKDGSFTDLRPMKDALVDRGLSVTIE
jgi:ATP-dependent Clp protease adaptor protein ClpS